MRCLLVIVLFFMSIIHCYSQSLSLNELFKLRNMSFIDFVDYLENKGWKLSSNTQNRAFLFSFNETDNGAESWIQYSKRMGDDEVMIRFQTSNQNNFNTIKSSIKSLKAKAIDLPYPVIENIIYSAYKTKNFEINLERHNDSETKKVSYVVFITKRSPHDTD